MAESFVDSFKTELIADRVWRTRTQLELAIVEYVGWFNTTRLHESLGDLPPAEFETLSPSGTVHLSLAHRSGRCHQPQSKPGSERARSDGEAVDRVVVALLGVGERDAGVDLERFSGRVA